MDSAYRSAGVNIDAGNESVRRISRHVKSTYNQYVLSEIGGFGGMFAVGEYTQSYQDPVLVQSTDSIGTKTMIASMMGQFDTIGHDMVAHSINDILVQGARPITFLDYIAVGKVVPVQIEAMVQGLSAACAQANIALVGGETAELPGVYQEGEFDLVGTITGVVEKSKIITGETIRPGDVVFGFASSGLHTNGYSLARHILFEQGNYSVTSEPELLSKSVGEVLLTPHTSYAVPILAMLDAGIPIRGLAHITGGGLLENIPRILPKGCSVRLDCSSWPILPIFTLMQNCGAVPVTEMYRVFNMGIGMVVIVRPQDYDAVLHVMVIVNNYKEYPLYEIGQVVAGGGVFFVNM